MKNQKILAVDADQQALSKLTRVLENCFDVQSLTDGSQCLEITKEIKPALILLDHERSGLNCIELCKQLKNDPFTQDIPVLFVSEKTNLTVRLNAYDAGAEDFIQRPYDENELIVRIKLILGYKRQLVDLKQETDEASSMTLSAFMELGEIAVIVEFFRKSFCIRSIEKLADSFLNVLLQYKLTATLFICTSGECLYVSSNNHVTEEDKMLFQEKGDLERIHSFDESTMFNFKHCNLLVQQMSVDNPEQYGRDKDNIALLGEGVDARIDAINYEEAQIQQGIKRQQVIKKTKLALNSFNQQQDKQQNEALGTIDWLAKEIDSSFLSLGLSELQEEFLLDLIKIAQQRSNNIFAKNTQLSQLLESIMFELHEDIGTSKDVKEDNPGDIDDHSVMLF